jgi:hypothetical protein
MQFDALDRVLSKIDVMGAPPLSPRERRVSAATAWRSGAVGASAPAAAPAPAAALAEAVGATIQRASSFGRRPKAPNHKQQLKHALTVNAAHVITQDYVMLSRPLTDGLMLMDAQERKLRMVRSLGELLPLRRYTTEYGNTLERVSKHKAVLAGTIELPIATDEVGFDEHLARLALEPAAGRTPQAAERMAAYDAIRGGGADGDAAAAGSSRAAPHGENGGGPSSAAELDGDGRRAAMERLEAMGARLSELEGWCDAAKAEAAQERQMREQASRRLEFVQERFERMQAQVQQMRAENDELRRRVHDLQNAEPEHEGMARAVGRHVGMGVSGVGAPPPPISTSAAGTSRAPLSPGGASEPSPTVSLNLGLQLASGQGIF